MKKGEFFYKYIRMFLISILYANLLTMIIFFVFWVKLCVLFSLKLQVMVIVSKKKKKKNLQVMVIVQKDAVWLGEDKRWEKDRLG